MPPCNTMWLFFLFVSGLLCFSNAGSSNSNLNDDVLGLIVFKAELHDPSGALNSWNEDDNSPCNWKYVSCDQKTGRVTGLILEGLQLSGKICRGLEKVEFLRMFSIAHNNFSGNLSLFDARLAALGSLDMSYNDFSGSITGAFGSMKFLYSLDLSNNRLSGFIPDGIFVGSLISLSLASNMLSGSIPSSLGKCMNLRKLNLSDNLMSDLGSALWQLRNLRVMDLSGNNFSGNVQFGAGRLPNLREFYMQRNGFQGPIPGKFGEFLNLRVLDLSQNQFTGELPESFQALSSLVSLKLQQNKLEGSIPSWLGGLSQIQELDLTDNNFRGKIPDSIGLLKNLKTLAFSNNYFSGSIPAALSKCTSLSSLDLSSNKLSGTVPAELFGLGLERVNMSFNNLTGSIPSGSSHLYWFLQELDLSNNRLSGGIPVNISLCFNMRYLNLSWNSLQATIPPQVGNLRFLQVLDLGNNKLYGSIPPWLFHSEDLQFLLLNDNSLSGNIPLDIANCTSLNAVSLSINHLDGPIPLEISKLHDLASLNLSYNNLTGIVPRELGKLPNLQVLDVSFNQLQGRIPTEGIFKKLNITWFQGNDNLCGENLNVSCQNLMPKPLVLNPNGNNFKNGGPFGMISVRHRVILSVSAIVAIVAAAVIALGVIIVTVLNIRAQNHVIFEDAGGESAAALSIHSDSPVGKLVMFSPKPDIVAENWISSANILLRKDSEIGKGGFGSVYKTVLEDGKIVAVKKLMISDLVKSKDDFEREVQILGKVKHPNLVTLKGYYWTQQQQLLIYEYIQHGSLYNKLHGKVAHKPYLNWQTRFKIALGIARGLAHLHQASVLPIIHYNLKSSNVLLDDDWNPRITDYGLAKLLPVLDRYILTSKFQTGLGYVAPEFACQSMRINEKCDVFGYGVLVLELITGRRPVEDMEDDVVILCDYVNSLNDYGDVLSCVDPNLYAYPESEVTSVIKLALMCTSQVPSSRPSMAEVVQILQMIKNPLDSRERI